MNVKLQRHSLILCLLVAIIVASAAVSIWHHFNTTGSATAKQTSTARGAARERLSPVQVAMATQQTVARYLTGLGTVTAANTVTMTSRVRGQLMALHFIEGQQVQAGDLLAEIDPRPFQVQLTQAQGQLAKDRAVLANVRRDLARYQQLVKTNLISRQEWDAQLSLVQQGAGAIKADQGAVDSAQLQLTYSKIIAPISGRVGLKQIDKGNDITSGTTAIVMITQTHSIDVVFTPPESTISDIISAQKTGPVSVEASSNKSLLAQGSLLSLDNQIDTTTGTIKLKARYDNQNDTLFPNQFVNARLKIATLQNAIVVPSAAVQMSNAGNFVWILDEENKVSKQWPWAGRHHTADGGDPVGGDDRLSFAAGFRSARSGLPDHSSGDTVPRCQP